MDLFLWLIIRCFNPASSYEIATTLRTKTSAIQAWVIDADPRCINVQPFTNYANSKISRPVLCNSICMADSSCIGYTFDKTSCSFLSYLRHSPLVTDTVVNFYGFESESIMQDDIARNKNVVAFNGIFWDIFPTFYAHPSTVTKGVGCVKTDKDCWCGQPASILVDLGSNFVVLKIILTPHPFFLESFGIGESTVYVGRDIAGGTFYGLVQSIPAARQTLQFAGNVTGRYITVLRPTWGSYLCLCFIQAFGYPE